MQSAQPLPEQPDTCVDAPAWPDGCLALLHELWGDAKLGVPYSRTQKRKFARLLAGLELAQARGCLVKSRPE